jgi:mannose-6-phosphate isomerase
MKKAASVPPATIKSVDSMRDWLIRDCLPVWIDAGFDPKTGGFHEILDFQGNPDPSAPRRLTVQGRQIFTYARAMQLGWADCRDKIDSAFTAMIEHYRSPDGKPGFVFKVDGKGGIVDGNRDLYAHAFVLLAAAAYYSLTKDTQAIALADDTLAYLDEALTAPRGGYFDSHPHVPGVLRQNPHMHLFEALLALHESTGEARYLGRAGEKFGYLKTHFFRPETDILAEYFDHDWVPIGGADAMWEPGHHMEWAWLLSEYQTRTGTVTKPIVDRLLAKAYTYGVRPPALIVDEVRGDGVVMKSGSRTWPLTEAAKAQAVRLHSDPLAAERLQTTFDWMFDRHLTSPGMKPGLWKDHFAEDGTLLTKNSPASTLYHIAMSVFVADKAVKSGK